MTKNPWNIKRKTKIESERIRGILVEYFEATFGNGEFTIHADIKGKTQAVSSDLASLKKTMREILAP